MNAPHSAWLLEADHIVKRFGNNEVLRGVSVRAKKGDVISMIGASGSGKSTFLRCLNLLEQPHGGRIAVDGETLDDAFSQQQRWRRFSRVGHGLSSLPLRCRVVPAIFAKRWPATAQRVPARA